MTTFPANTCRSNGCLHLHYDGTTVLTHANTAIHIGMHACIVALPIHDMLILYDTTDDFNVDSKAECDRLI